MKRWLILYNEFTSFEGSLFRYSLSFSLLLALAPSLLLFAMLFKYFYIADDVILNFIMQFFPGSSEEMINQIFQFFTERNFSSIISFVITICTSFYLASRSIYSFLLISASHEDVDVPKWSIRIKSILMFVIMSFALVAAIYVVTQLLDFLPEVATALMLVMFYVLYRSLSFRKRTWSFGLVGAIFTTFSMLLLAALFVTVVTYFTSYQTIYGPLASLVTLLLAIYLISCIIYLGYCLNIISEEDYGSECDLPLKNPRAFEAARRLTDSIVKRFKKV